MRCSRFGGNSIASSPENDAGHFRCDQFESWLTGRVGLEILRPAPGDVLLKCPISKRVNDMRMSDEDATLIEHI